MPSWIVEIAAMVASWIAMSVLVLAWLGSSRSRATTAPGLMQHPVSTLVLGLAAIAGAAFLAWLVNRDGAGTWWLNGLLVTGGLLSLMLVADFAFARHRVSEVGLEYGSMMGRRGELAWSELAHVRYAPLVKWFRLTTASGKVARISAMHTGLSEFARQLLGGAPPEAIDPATLQVLTRTAGGKLPPLWR